MWPKYVFQDIFLENNPASIFSQEHSTSTSFIAEIGKTIHFNALFV